MGTLKNEAGNRYGRLLVIAQAEHMSIGGILIASWLCLCDCGKTCVRTGGALRSGIAKSCGCLRHDVAVERATKHGLCGHPAHESYSGAKQRCCNPKHKNYPQYGGRGIEFRLPPLDEFWELMGSSWFKGATLERIDNDAHYEIGNVRWATRREQCLNTRRARKITFNGVTKNLCEWAEDLNINQSSLRERIERWGLERALTTPKPSIKS